MQLVVVVLHFKVGDEVFQYFEGSEELDFTFVHKGGLHELHDKGVTRKEGRVIAEFSDEGEAERAWDLLADGGVGFAQHEKKLCFGLKLPDLNQREAYRIKQRYSIDILLVMMSMFIITSVNVFIHHNTFSFPPYSFHIPIHYGEQISDDIFPSVGFLHFFIQKELFPVDQSGEEVAFLHLVHLVFVAR